MSDNNDPNTPNNPQGQETESIVDRVNQVDLARQLNNLLTEVNNRMELVTQATQTQAGHLNAMVVSVNEISQASSSFVAMSQQISTNIEASANAVIERLNANYFNRVNDSLNQVAESARSGITSQSQAYSDLTGNVDDFNNAGSNLTEQMSESADHLQTGLSRTGEEARQVLEHAMDIKSKLKPKFDKLWENDIFKKWVVYEAASGNYKFSGDDELKSTEAAMANRILQFNSSGNIKDVMITPEWAKGYSSAVKSNVGYKAAGKTKFTSFRLMTEQGVKNPEKYNSLYEYDMEQILNTEQVKLNEGINKIIEQSELLQEGFFDNLVKKGKSLVSKLKRVLTTLMNKIKNFLKKYFIDVAKKEIAKIKEYAQNGFDFFVEALGIQVDGSATVGKISL